MGLQAMTGAIESVISMLWRLMELAAGMLVVVLGLLVFGGAIMAIHEVWCAFLEWLDRR